MYRVHKLLTQQFEEYTNKCNRGESKARVAPQGNEYTEVYLKQSLCDDDLDTVGCVPGLGSSSSSYSIDAEVEMNSNENTIQNDNGEVRYYISDAPTGRDSSKTGNIDDCQDGNEITYKVIE